MSSRSAIDGPGGEPAAFACEWSPNGIEAASVRVAGELDLDSAPRLKQVLDEGLGRVRLVLVDVRELSFVDSSGLHVLLDAAQRARNGGSRLVLVGVSVALERLLDLTRTRALIDMLADAPAGEPRAAGVSAAGDGVDPARNPVNAAVVAARVMDIRDRGLWAHAPDGTIWRAWAPASEAPRVPAGERIEIYVDQRGAINGWRHPSLGLAINQRRLAPGAEPATAEALACQGACGVLWRAPAAARLLEHGERCLTCAGALARL